jgi:hypothetical protein
VSDTHLTHDGYKIRLLPVHGLGYTFLRIHRFSLALIIIIGIMRIARQVKQKKTSDWIDERIDILDGIILK